MSSHLKYMSYYYMLFIIEFIRVFFFFQAEDGIRDIGVTGVQTCAFLISSRRRHTRYWRDWSSDVCSSDLVLAQYIKLTEHSAAKAGADMLIDAPQECTWGEIGDGIKCRLLNGPGWVWCVVPDTFEPLTKTLGDNCLSGLGRRYVAHRQRFSESIPNGVG